MNNKFIYYKKKNNPFKNKDSFIINKLEKDIKVLKEGYKSTVDYCNYLVEKVQTNMNSIDDINNNNKNYVKYLEYIQNRYMPIDTIPYETFLKETEEERVKREKIEYVKLRILEHNKS